MKKKESIPTWLQMLISFFVLLFIVMKCKSCSSESKEEDPYVKWENYDKSVKIRIDSLSLAKNCSALQEEFNMAESNSSSQRARVGEGNALLMAYIDSKLVKNKCH